MAAPGSAAITATGSYRPAYEGVADPWDLGAEVDLYVGETAAGSLTIDEGSNVVARQAYFGSSSGGVGDVTISGDGSTLQTSLDMSIGLGGRGLLWLTDGGRAVVGGVTRIHRPNSSYDSAIYFSGGTLETGSLFTLPRFLQGEGVISANGLVSNFDLTFDASRGTSQEFLFDSEPGQNIVLHLSEASDTQGFHYLAVGNGSQSTLTITHGRHVKSAIGVLGLAWGHGAAKVSGLGSMWEVTDSLTIGGSQTGSFVVDRGGVVLASQAIIGGSWNSYVILKVTGLDSRFTGNNLSIRGPSSFVVEDSGAAHITDQLVIGLMPTLEDGTPTVAVRGHGSELSVDSFLGVGNTTEGRLNVEAGGRVNVFYLAAGSLSRQHGTIVATGVGSVIEAEYMTINFTTANPGSPIVINGSTSVVIEHGALLKVNGTIDSNLRADYPGPGFALRDGGMLALPRDNDDSLAQFLGATEIQTLKILGR